MTIRFTHGRINQRAKSNLFIKEEYWNLSDKLSKIRTLIHKSFNEVDKENLPKDWLKQIINKYNFPENDFTQEEPNKLKSFFDLFDKFLQKRKLSEVREKNYMVLNGALQRFELFVIKADNQNFKLDVNSTDADVINDF